MISIILPTYNEKENIVPLIEAIAEVFSQMKKQLFEIIVVDDNSPDGTSEAVNKYLIKNKNIKLITRKEDRGLASAIKTGIYGSKGEYIAIMDTDFSHSPEYLRILINTIKENDYDTVIASRYIRGGGMDVKKYKYLLSKLINNILVFVLNIKIRDLTGGFFIIKKSLLEKVDLEKIFVGYGDYFFRLFYELKKIKYSFKELPFKYISRKYGESKTKTFKMGVNYFKTMFLLRLGK